MLTKRTAMRRMNEMWRRTALTLVFYVLLFHTCHGEDVSTGATSTYTNTTQDSMSTLNSTVRSTDLSHTTLTPTNDTDTKVNDTDSTTQEELQNSSTIQGHTISRSDPTDAPEQHQATSKATIEQDTTQTVVHGTSPSVDQVQEKQDIHKQWGGKQTIPPEQSNSKNVFVPVLVTGLILAAALIGLYVWRNHCRTNASVMKIADESCMADEENQGNTLVSVAPLNPPENQEKPSQNGESLETVKTQNPPAATNGHSTAKADTEL